MILLIECSTISYVRFACSAVVVLVPPLLRERIQPDKRIVDVVGRRSPALNKLSQLVDQGDRLLLGSLYMKWMSERSIQISNRS
jgi:hypothetical protein